jgi:hypothetical protein
MNRKNILKLFVLLFATVAIVAGCNKEEEKEKKDENPFTGKDNYITAFSLQQGDAVFDAAITGATITVTAPEGFSLAGAAATVTLSENAAISPNPSTIADWDAAHTFTVTAYSGAQKQYDYNLLRSGVVHSGTAIFNTQDDVRAFAQAGYTLIDGNLSIGRATGIDSIISLDGLERLKTVTGNIAINATCSVEDITAFENLEKTGGLYIASKKAKTVRFPKLATVFSDVNFDQTTALKSIDFAELINVDKGLRIYYADSLANINFPKLKQVIENVTLQGRNSSHSPLSVEFPALQTVSGTFTVTYLPKTESIIFPELKTVAALSVNNCASLTAIDLRALETASGNDDTGGLTLTGLSELRALNLSSLKRAAAISFTGLVNIAEIDVHDADALSLEWNASAAPKTDLKLTGPDEFSGKFKFTAPSSITEYSVTVQGFRKVGDVDFGGGNANVDLNLSFIEEVTGKLNFSNASGTRIDLSNLKSTGELSFGSYLTAGTINLANLEYVTGNTTSGNAGTGIFYSVYYNLVSLEFPKLKSVEGNIAISGIRSVRPLKQILFPKLESISGNLEIGGDGNNTVFTDLDFGSLTYATGVKITGLKELKDFASFGGLFNPAPILDESAWNVTNCGYNPSYQDMIDGKYGDND